MKNVKTALVTGVCRGIGKAIAEELSKEGYHVVGLHKGKDETCELIKSTDSIEIHKVDLNDRSKILKFIELQKDTKFEYQQNSPPLSVTKGWG